MHGCMSARDGGPCPICYPRPAPVYSFGVEEGAQERWLLGEAEYQRNLERRQQRDWEHLPVGVLF